jgi:hypothetical protein
LVTGIPVNGYRFTATAVVVDAGTVVVGASVVVVGATVVVVVTKIVVGTVVVVGAAVDFVELHEATRPTRATVMQTRRNAGVVDIRCQSS